MEFIASLYKNDYWPQEFLDCFRDFDLTGSRPTMNDDCYIFQLNNGACVKLYEGCALLCHRDEINVPYTKAVEWLELIPREIYQRHIVWTQSGFSIKESV